MKSIIFYSFIAILFTVSGCQQNEDKAKSKQEAVDAVPPSLSSEKDKVKIVKLSDNEIKELNIKVVYVNEEIKNYITVAPGIVNPAPGHVSLVSAPVDGRITSINHYEGDSLGMGKILFSMESLTFGNLVADYLRAVAEKDYQKNRLKRLKQLVEKKISSQSELDRAQSDYKRASAAVNAAYSKLRAVGVPEYEIKKFTSLENIDPALNLRAHISGTVDQMMVEMGQSVNANDKMARIIDKTHVLIKGYVSPQDAQFIQVGDSVRISLRNDESRVITGQVNSINPGLDKENRSVVVNIIVPTKNEWPKSGENVRLQIFTNSLEEVVAIPIEAITYDGKTPIVFVKLSEGEYEKRPLEVSDIRDKYAFVSSGLKKNEQIAISQVFSLKALARYEQFSE